MSLEIIYGDITKMEVDAIVAAADIFPEYDVGEARITDDCNLPAKYLIQTEVPGLDEHYHSGNEPEGFVYWEDELLKLCYYNALRLAKEHDCESVAFPLLGCDFPEDIAMELARDTIEALSDSS